MQPVRNSFSQVGPIKMVLEDNLRLHAALSVGDIIVVWYRGTSHELRVNVMQPGPFGSLVRAVC